MNLLRSVLATFRFEFWRSWSWQRIAVASVLAGFPPAMVTVISQSGESRIPITDLLIVTLVSVVGMLAQLLWATPNVYAELEGKSWIFIASRPRGRINLFLGKYLSAVGFSFGVCFIAISLSLAGRTWLPPQSMVNPFPTLVGMTGSALFGCAVYAAIFSLIGTVFQKRAMVFGAAYIIVWEIILGGVPAIVGMFTARFHLQALAGDWIGWFYPIPREEYAIIYGEYTATFHIVSLAAALVVLLVAGCVVITTRQYITADET